MGNTLKIVREGVPYRKLLHPALSYSVMGHYEIRKAKLSDAGAVRTRVSGCPTTGVMPLYIKASNSAEYERRVASHAGRESV